MFNLCPPKLKNEQKSSLTTIILITNFSFLDGRHVPQQPEQPQQRWLPLLLHRHIRKLLNFHQTNFLLYRHIRKLLNFHLNNFLLNRYLKQLLNFHLNIFLLNRYLQQLLNFHLNNLLLNRYLKHLLNFHLNKCFINGHIKKLLNCHLTIFLFEKKIASSSVPSHFRFKLD